MFDIKSGVSLLGDITGENKHPETELSWKRNDDKNFHYDKNDPFHIKPQTNPNIYVAPLHDVGALMIPG